jgi:hypothetical protein
LGICFELEIVPESVERDGLCKVRAIEEGVNFSLGEERDDQVD